MASPSALFMDPEHCRTEFVSGSHVDAIEFAVLRYGVEMDNAGCIHDGQSRSPELSGQASYSADPAGLISGGKECQQQVRLGYFGGRHQREPISGRSYDQVRPAPAGKQFDECARIVESFG